jgi:hypothetical protein
MRPWQRAGGALAAVWLLAAAPALAAHRPDGGAAAAPSREHRHPEAEHAGGPAADGAEGRLSEALASHVVAGVVQAVASGSLTVGDRTLPVAPEALAWQHGNPEPVDHLTPGTEVVAILSGGQVAFVDELGGPTGTQVAGVVASLEGRRLVLAVPGAAGASVSWAVYHVPDHATVSGAVYAFQDLAPGDQVTLTVAPHALVLAVDVTAAPATVSGTVQAVRDGAVVVDDQGVPVTFRLADHTAIVANGQSVSRRDLVPGDAVTVTPGPHGTAQEVDITAQAQPTSTAASGGGGDQGSAGSGDD